MKVLVEVGKAFAVAALAVGVGCTPAMFGQTDNFPERLDRGCSTLQECDQLVQKAEKRNAGCKPNTMGKLRCSDTWKDLERARALREPMAKQAEEAAAKKKEAEKRERQQQAAPAAKADYEARQKKARAMAEEEIKTGRCHEKKVGAFRQIVAQAPRIFTNDQALITVEAHKLVVATSEGVPLEVDAGLGGEYHIMAFSFAPVKLTVKDGQGYEVKDESFLADGIQGIFMPIAADGRALTTNTGDTLSVSTEGFGCTLLMVVHRTVY